MKHTVKFDLFPQKSDCKPIRARVTYGGCRVDLRIGYSIEPEKWDNATMRARPGFKNKYKQSGNEINKAILLCQEQIESIFTRFELWEKRQPNPEELKQEFGKYLGKESKKPIDKKRSEEGNVFTVYDKFVNEQSLLNSWSKSHKNRHITVKNHLFEYEPNLTFEDVTKETLVGFLNELFDKELCNTTIHKLISYLRNFLHWAFDEGYYTGNQHEKFKPKLKGADGSHKTVIYLSWEELMILYNFKVPKEKQYLDRVRDVLCFCSFTGLRYSDTFNLSKTDVQKERISVITQKTVAPLYIELNDYSTKLLKKYESLPIKKALPVISNQKMNEYLKELGELAGLTAPTKVVHFRNNKRYEEIHPKYAVLTTHCGRRTFIVMAITLGIPIAVIMKWTGHKSYASMKPYIEIVDSLKEKEMKKFNNGNKKMKTQKRTQK
ncbi:MAG: site-specific integrase [Candidatus Symbiothrix sp.]|jgi:integrase|nr:site-specific integrase [Candidatus Symbiothrix sp.]